MKKKPEKESRSQKVKIWLAVICFFLIIGNFFIDHPVYHITLTCAVFIYGIVHAIFNEGYSDWAVAVICAIFCAAFLISQFPTLFPGFI
jgi:D-alanyl-lipoteichoic acid acyltransferase DltB (MBOAT superfamily)